MSANVRRFYAALFMLGLLASCAQLDSFEVQNANTRKNARTHADHDNLAKYFENTAKEMEVKAEEQKKLMQHYEDKSYLYGANGQTFQAHTSAMIRSYERAARENLKEAAFHRERAAELTKREYAAPTEIPRQRNNREEKARIKPDSIPTELVGSSSRAM